VVISASIPRESSSKKEIFPCEVLPLMVLPVVVTFPTSQPASPPCPRITSRVYGLRMQLKFVKETWHRLLGRHGVVGRRQGKLPMQPCSTQVTCSGWHPVVEQDPPFESERPTPPDRPNIFLLFLPAENEYSKTPCIATTNNYKGSLLLHELKWVCIAGGGFR